MALLATGGCVRVYQPMSGLHDPVVVDPQLPNFTGLRVGVRCLPGGVLSPQEASGMCDKIDSLFENQGAIVRTWTTPGPVPDDDPFPTDDPDAPPPPADLTMQLRSREIHHSEYPLSWVVSIVSFTLVPAIIEETFSHDIEVRDGSGFLLSRDELQGRIVQYFGAGTWIGNTVLDLTLRSDEEELTGLRANEHLSADFYAQLSQALFDAHMRARVLGAQVEVTP